MTPKQKHKKFSNYIFYSHREQKPLPYPTLNCNPPNAPFVGRAALQTTSEAKPKEKPLSAYPIQRT